MVHKNEFGKFILSAGEISSYIVCPEAWRLRCVEKVDSIYVDAVKEGNRLHKEWAKDVDEALFFTRSTRIILILISLVVSVFIFKHFF